MSVKDLLFKLKLVADSNDFNNRVNGAKFAVNALVSAMAAIGVSLGVRELAEAADSYTNLSTRIQIATREHGNFTEAIAGVHQIAINTNSTLDATATLFTRLNTVGQDMGMTQQQALDLTKTITQAIQVSGGSAQQSEAAITQFIQAMQGGVLRGEEFNSIMENGYGLAEALAKGLNVTTGELRGMADAGELSAERVVKAIGSQSAEIEKLYGQFPTTIGNALQRIATSWQIVIGEMDQANGSSAAVADALVMVADNLGIIKIFLDDVGNGFRTLVTGLEGGIDSSTIDAFKNAISAAYDVVKDLAATVYELGSSTLDILGDALGTASALFSSFTGGVTEANEQVSFLERVIQGLSIGFGFVSDGLAAIKIAIQLMTGGFYDLAGAVNSVMTALTWGDLSKQFAANADLMKDKAKQYYAEAEKGAMDFQSKGIQRLNEAAGIEQQGREKSLAETKKLVDQLLGEQSREVEGKKATEEEKLAAVQAYAEAAIAANGGVIDGTMQADLINKGYIVTVDEIGRVSVEAWKKGEEGAEGAANAADKARKAAANLELDLYELKNGYTEAFAQGAQKVREFANGVEELGFEGQKAGDAVYQAWLKWLQTAKSTGEVELAEQALKEFGASGRLSTAQVEQGMLAIRSVVGKLPADLSPVEEAYERLGIKTKEQLRLAAQSALADFNTIQASGQATAEGIRQAYVRAMQAASASGDQAVIAATQAKAASLGLRVEIDETGRATVKSMSEAEDAIHRVRNATGHAGSGFDDLGRRGVASGNATRDAWEEARQAAEAAANASSSVSDSGMSGRKSRVEYTLEGVKQMLRDKGFTDEKDIERKANELFNADGLTRKTALNLYQYEAGKNLPSFMTKDFKAVNMMAAGNKDYIDLMMKNLTPSSGNSGGYAPSTPSASSVASGGASKNVKYDIQFGGQTLSLAGDEGSEDTMNKLIKQLQGVAKST